MIIKFNDVAELTPELIDQLIMTMESIVAQSKKVNSPKFLIIDWSDADVTKFDVNKFTKDQIVQLLDTINNREILGIFYKKIELKNEEYLWSRLVNDRIISDELYQKNTYDENLDILYKVRKPVLV